MTGEVASGASFFSPRPIGLYARGGVLAGRSECRTRIRQLLVEIIDELQITPAELGRLANLKRGAVAKILRDGDMSTAEVVSIMYLLHGPRKESRTLDVLSSRLMLTYDRLVPSIHTITDHEF